MKKIIITTLFLLTPVLSHAATLSMDPAVKSVGSGDVFVVNIRIDVSQDECVNAASVAINYPKNLLRLNTLSRGESIFTLWIDENINHDAGEARFSSGIPGGYCGHTAGDPGNTNIIGKIAFQYIGDQKQESAQIQFMPETEVILNDGLGTKAELNTIGSTINNVESSGVKNEWLEVVKQDTFSPESFTPLIIQDTTTEEKPYILVFDTIDKQSGVEHYEVVEEDPVSFGFRFGSRVKAKLSIAKSPYVLFDQTLSSRIVIRAYDHAGNVQEEIVPPKNMPPLFDPYKYEDYITPLIIIAFGTIIVILIIRIRNKRSKQDKEDDIQAELDEVNSEIN